MPIYLQRWIMCMCVSMGPKMCSQFIQFVVLKLEQIINKSITPKPKANELLRAAHNRPRQNTNISYEQHYFDAMRETPSKRLARLHRITIYLQYISHFSGSVFHRRWLARQCCCCCLKFSCNTMMMFVIRIICGGVYAQLTLQPALFVYMADIASSIVEESIKRKFNSIRMRMIGR